MKIKIQLITFILIFINGNIFPQVIQEWVRTYNSNSNLYDETRSMVIDPFGNICVTGVSIQNGSYDDIVTIKYNPDGIQQWVRIYQSSGTQYDNSYSIVSDEFGNIYVAGNSGYAYDKNIIVLKYDLLGILQWVKTYDGNAHSFDVVNDIAIDKENYIYITGCITQTGSSIDLCTIKYSPFGELLWISTYNNPLVNKWDWGNALVIDDSCNIYITGFSDGTGVTHEADYITIKYDSSGTCKWVQRYDGPANSTDYSYTLVIDDSCNVFVTGLSMGINTAQDYATIKYNSEGILQWIQRYNGTGNRYDQATSIMTDNTGGVYVSGRSQNQSGSMDLCTIKYSSEGTQLWLQRILGNTNYSVEAYVIAIDNNDFIYVTGRSSTSYLTVKYSSNGLQQWIISSPGSRPYNKILVDDLRNVYITGSANADFITIKYSQPIGINIVSNEIPESYSLSQNYPNPFNPQTKIKFDIPANVKGQMSNVKLIIYDLLGREVTTLVNEELRPGTYEADWDGSSFSSGVYFYKIITEDFVETKKMVLIK